MRESHGNGKYSFNHVVTVLGEIGEKYGTWQQKECLVLKKKLMDLENEKNGCVPAGNFYKSMLNDGKWQFSESMEYLRDQGALDESDLNNQKVMIPNYLDGPS